MASSSQEADVEIWRRCALWLTKWKVLHEDHEIHRPESDIHDFAKILINGVLLCRLCQNIDPGCIDGKNVSFKPLAQFLCLRNINIFLKICEENFNLKEAELFEDVMLFELADFYKVLSTLSLLSQSQKALKSGIKGFSTEIETNADEDEIYENLRTDFLRVAIPLSDIRDPYFDSVYYADLNVLLNSEEAPCARGDKKCFAVREISSTEKGYVIRLSQVYTSFMIPLQSYMEPAHHACLFNKIRELNELHSSFLKELTETRTGQKKLSQIFLDFQDQFLIYAEYCENYERAFNLFHRLYVEDEDFNAIVTRYENDLNNGHFKLTDVLIAPVQRLMRYHLLLDAVISKTDKEKDEEYEGLCRAKEAMSDVADYANDYKADAEMLTAINSTLYTIIGMEYDPARRLSDYGKLILDTAIKMTDLEGKKIKDRYLFIFQKCILICKQIGGLFDYRESLNVMEYTLVEDTISSNKQTSFLLVENGGRIYYNVFCRTVKLKKQVTSAIHHARDSVQPEASVSSAHSLKLHTFDTPIRCGQCNKYLKGRICQGYICKSCDVPLHKGCIESSKECIPLRSTPGRSSNLSDTISLEDGGKKLWYVEEMDRNTAEEKLRNRENGTFLVRIGRVSYVLSLKISETFMEHMQIFSMKDGPSAKYYFSGLRYFDSLEELILHYQRYSLRPSFSHLDENTKLLYPIGHLKAVVKYDFDAGDNPYYLSVRKGQTLIIIGKDLNGFVKGKTRNNEIGYFPAVLASLEGEVIYEEETYLNIN